MENLMQSRAVLAGLAITLICSLVGAYIWYVRSAAPPLEGRRDSHGCLASEGYSWCGVRQACEKASETYCTEAQGTPVQYACNGEQSVLATFYPADDTYVDLVLSSGRKLSLPRTVSTSGTRYAPEDESVVFWNHGDMASITEGGVPIFDNCTKI